MATRKAPQRAGKALTRWIKRQQLDSGLRRCEVVLRWQELVGARVAARTQPRALNKGVLTVEVSNSAWLNELSFLRERLRRRVDRGLGGGRVSDLRLVLRSGVGQHAAVPPPPAAAAPTRREREAAQHQADAELPQLTDAELRSRIRRARQAQLLTCSDSGD